MKRSALRDYLRTLVLATMAASAAGCSDRTVDLRGDFAPSDDSADFALSDNHWCAGFDAGSGTYHISVGPSDPDGGDDCMRDCEDKLGHQIQLSRLVSCHTTSTTAVGREIDCTYQGMCGRRPEGLEAAAGCASTLGGVLANMAHLEAASVPAFRRLARELERFGAPRALVELARTAVRDEIRHARAVGGLARARGAQVPKVVRAPERRRSLIEFAVENAVEGCVGETVGALTALWQSVRAEDAEVRAVFAEIATDEVAHAELAWAIARWAEEQLDDEERALVKRARSSWIAAQLDASASLEDDVRRLAGLPTAAERRTLVGGLARLA
jgi:hypothetical protein